MRGFAFGYDWPWSSAMVSNSTSIMPTVMPAQPVTRRTLIAAGLMSAAGHPLAAPTAVPLALDENTTLPRALDLLAPDLDFTWSTQTMPWARVLNVVERGESIGMNVGYSRSREARFVFSEPIFIKRAWMFVKKTDNLQFKGFADLQRRRLCVRRNVSYGDAFEAAADRDYQLVAVDIPLEGRLRMILNDRCDITLLSSGETHPGRAERRLAKWPDLATDVRVVPTPMATQTSHFVALKGSPLTQHLPVLNRAIRRHHEALKALFAADGE